MSFDWVQKNIATFKIHQNVLNNVFKPPMFQPLTLGSPNSPSATKSPELPRVVHYEGDILLVPKEYISISGNYMYAYHICKLVN